MWWAIAAAAGKELLGGVQGARAESKRSEAQNKLIMQYNKDLMTQHSKQVSQMNLQRSMERTKTSAALFSVEQQKRSAESAAQHQAAASDTIGASIKDAKSTIGVGADRAYGSAVRNLEQAELGLDLALSKLTDQTITDFKKEDHSNAIQMMTAAVSQATGSAIGSYAASKMDVDPNNDNEDKPATPEAKFDWFGVTERFKSSTANFNFMKSPTTGAFGSGGIPYKNTTSWKTW